MPGLDKTGPEGKGPKTGRAMGTCSTKSDTNDLTPNQPIRMRNRRRFRMGNGNCLRLGRRTKTPLNNQ